MKATHFMPGDAKATACGRVGVRYTADHHRNVDCLACLRVLKSWRSTLKVVAVVSPFAAVKQGVDPVPDTQARG